MFGASAELASVMEFGFYSVLDCLSPWKLLQVRHDS